MQDRWPEVPGALVADLDAISPHIGLEVFWAVLALGRPVELLARRSCRSASELDVASLPYNHEIVNYIRRQRANGGQTILVTTRDRALAEQIAKHLDVFDEVLGPEENSRLEGCEKAVILKSRFHEGGFAYLGRAAADLPVWKQSSQAMTVDATSAVRSRVDSLVSRTHHLETGRRPSLLSYITTLRPHQWLKNCLVFVPMLAAHQITTETLLQSLLGFIAFSITASSVYVLNDLLDLAADRAHPRKRDRPLAAGVLPLSHGTGLAPLLLASGLALALPLGTSFLLILLAYFSASTLYSLYIKRQIVIDICTLAGLYTLRIVAGGVATGISLSVWLLAFAMFIFFSLAAVKRQAELVDRVSSNAVRIGGRGYRAGDLPLIAGMAMASGYVSVLVLALYVNSPSILELYSSPAALWGVCVVLLYWISRMVMVTHRGEMDDDPLLYAMRDPVSLACLIVVFAFAIGGTFI